MSSNAKLLNMDTQQNINFTEEEQNNIVKLVSYHKELHSRALSLSQSIESAKIELEKLVKELEWVKEREYTMYKELSEKYDLSENTVSQAAANFALGQK